jgi:hypothetical protein
MCAVRYKTGEQIATRGSLNCGILVRNAFKGQPCAPIENPGRGGRRRLPAEFDSDLHTSLCPHYLPQWQFWHSYPLSVLSCEKSSPTR